MSQYDPSIHHRQSVRIPGYDYASEGAYFITICVQDRRPIFGQIVHATMSKSNLCLIVDLTWKWLAEQYDYVDLGPYVVMPNHVHGIISLVTEIGGSPAVSTGSGVSENPRAVQMTRRKTVGRLIGAFKTVSKKRVNELRATPGESLWQRNYWEHVIRNERSFEEIASYIENNPMTWEVDKLFQS